MDALIIIVLVLLAWLIPGTNQVAPIAARIVIPSLDRTDARQCSDRMLSFTATSNAPIAGNTAGRR